MGPRLETIHPALAHLALGGLLLVVLGYAVARWRRSSQWTFVGDVALYVTASSTLAATAFGLVSNVVVSWPGGLERWRDLHLKLGVAASCLFVALSVWRWSARRRAANANTSGPFLAVVALAVAAVAATGAIGGEVLVYHAGMAVRAAGGGAFAPPLPRLGPDDPPRDFLSAMRGVRSQWGEIETRVGTMVVVKPRDDDFTQIAARVAKIHDLAGWMGDHAPAGAKHDQIVMMAQTLDGAAQDIGDAAAKKSAADVARALGEATAVCLECHKGARPGQ